jgi:hypothetical protein
MKVMMAFLHYVNAHKNSFSQFLCIKKSGTYTIHTSQESIYIYIYVHMGM